MADDICTYHQHPPRMVEDVVVTCGMRALFKVFWQYIWNTERSSSQQQQRYGYVQRLPQRDEAAGSVAAVPCIAHVGCGADG
jgi:hypothetical protein